LLKSLLQKYVLIIGVLQKYRSSLAKIVAMKHFCEGMNDNS